MIGSNAFPTLYFNGGDHDRSCVALKRRRAGVTRLSTLRSSVEVAAELDLSDPRARACLRELDHRGLFEGEAGALWRLGYCGCRGRFCRS